MEDINRNSLNCLPSIKDYKDALFRIHLPTHSSEEDKIKAIETISEYPGNDSLIALQSALLMIKIPIAGSREFALEGPGKVSIAAAKALARSYNYRCLETLLDILKDKSNHYILRQACICGLAGVNKHAAIEALLVCLNDIKPDIRLESLQSIKTTLDNCNDLSPYYRHLTIESLLFYFFYNFNRNLKISKAEQTLALYLISKYAKAESLELLRSILEREEDEQICLHALDIYLSIKDEKTEEFLSNLILQSDRPPSLYQAIAAFLGKAVNGSTAHKLNHIAKKPYWMIQGISILMPAYGQTLTEQFKAARRICGY